MGEKRVGRPQELRGKFQSGDLARFGVSGDYDFLCNLADFVLKGLWKARGFDLHRHRVYTVQQRLSSAVLPDTVSSRAHEHVNPAQHLTEVPVANHVLLGLDLCFLELRVKCHLGHSEA